MMDSRDFTSQLSGFVNPFQELDQANDSVKDRIKK